MQLCTKIFFIICVQSYTVDCDDKLAVYSLENIVNVDTYGNAGFEFFSIENRNFLASANFWDGKSADMSAKSALFDVQLNDNGHISLKLVQEFFTKGAHGVDHFRARNLDFLVIPSYYGCHDSSDPCYSTDVYKWDKGPSKFHIYQRLPSEGPSQSDHFIRDNNSFLVIAENFGNKASVFKLSPDLHSVGPENFGEFKHFQSIPCRGIASVAVVAARDAGIFLALASYHGGNTGWSTDSFVYHMSSANSQFELLKKIPTFGAHDAEMLLYGSSLFLFFSEDRNDKTSVIESQLFTIDLESREVVQVQAIPTDGAHGSELFVASDGSLNLAVANFGDRQGRRYASESTLWRWDVVLSMMVKKIEFATQGPTDVEHFCLNSRDYLAISNEGDISRLLHQTSPIVQLTVSHASTFNQHDL